jgi:hypothetical protein
MGGRVRDPLPIGPFQEWIRDEMRRCGWTKEQFARRIGVTERRVRFWLDPVESSTGRRQEVIGLGTADRVFCRLGEPWLLYEVWPHLGREEEAA